MRSRSPPCRGRGLRPFAAARRATSTRRPRPRAPRRGRRASVATIPGAPWHHCVRIWPSRCASSCVISAYGSQLTSPSSSTAKGLERLRHVGGIVAERERTACEPVCRPEAAARSPKEVLRPQAVSVALPLQPLDARRHVEPELAARENRARDCPSISSQRSSCSFAAISSDSRSRLACDGASLCNTSRIPVSPDQRLRSASSSGKSGGASSECSRYGHVVPPEVDETSLGKAMERGHDPGTAEIHRPETRGRVVVLLRRQCGCIGQPSSNALSASATMAAIAVRTRSTLHGSSASASCAAGVNSIERVYGRRGRTASLGTPSSPPALNHRTWTPVNKGSRRTRRSFAK